MEILIQKENLENAINITNNFIEKKDLASIKAHILIKTEKENILIKATDHELGIKLKIKPEKIIKDGTITISGKNLLNIIKVMKDNLIKIKEENEFINISQNTIEYKLPKFDYKEFPDFPKIDTLKKINISTINFINYLKKISPVIEINNPKIELNGALIENKEKINIVGTDTKRLSIITIENNNNEKFKLILPKKAIIEIQKLFSEDLEIYYNNYYLIMKNENLFFFSKLINGNFPQYERIIPQSFKYILNLKKEVILSAIKQVSIISHIINIKILPKEIIISSHNENENSNASTKIPFESNIENFEFYVDSKYLTDFLNNIETENFELKLNDSESPFVVKSENFLTIIMPVLV